MPDLKTRLLGLALVAGAFVGAATPADARDVQPLGANLERFAYPWPVEQLPVQIGTEAGQMSFMDVMPQMPNGRTAVLLHGKNFCAATWETTARALLNDGYRVLIPDQVGFCKSSKPREAQYTFAMLAEFTRQLMEARGISDATIIGHSTGGMLALHFGLTHPEMVEQMVLINPLGLTDRMAQGVPYVPLNRLIEDERAKDYAAIRNYQLNTYYHGEWEPRYDRWVEMLAGQYASANGEDVAVAQAKTSEMILTQPVAQHLERLRMPVTLMIGMLDTTTFGKGQAPADIRDRLEPIPALIPEAAARIPNARVVRFAGLGHSPQVEAPEVFEPALLRVLNDAAPPVQ